MVNEIKQLHQDHEFWHSFYKSMGKEDLFILKFWDGFDNFHDYVYETYPGYEKPLKAIDIAAYRRELEEVDPDDIDPAYANPPYALSKKDFDTLIRRTQVDLIDREDQMEIAKQDLDDAIFRAYTKGYGDGGVSSPKLEPKQVVDYVFDPNPTKVPQDLFDLLASVVQASYIQSWCEKPNPAFNNERPLNVWLYGDRQLIRDMVGRIEYGVFA